MLEGYKTWIGLAVTVLGMFGLGYLVTGAQLADVVDAVLKIAGVAIAVYGNYQAHKKIAELKG